MVGLRACRNFFSHATFPHMGHWKRNCPKYLADKKAGKEKSGIFDIHVIDVYLTNSRSSASVFDTILLLMFATRSRNCGINEGW